MNMFKKNGGFTLVELIVVIAILAILAAVAIPAYSGYITKAQDAGDTTALSAIKTAAQGALATEGAVVKIVVTTSNDAADKGKVTGVKAYLVDKTDANKLVEYVLMGATEHKAAADFDKFLGEVPTMKGSFAGKTPTWDNTANATATEKGKWIAK